MNGEDGKCQLRTVQCCVWIPTVSVMEAEDIVQVGLLTSSTLRRSSVPRLGVVLWLTKLTSHRVPSSGQHAGYFQLGLHGLGSYRAPC